MSVEIYSVSDLNYSIEMSVAFICILCELKFGQAFSSAVRGKTGMHAHFLVAVFHFGNP